MAIICRDRKLLFIMVPGTGCSVVGEQLREDFGGEWCPAPDDSRGGRALETFKHNTVPDIVEEGIMRPGELDDYLVFAAVRNPFSRWVTYYQRYKGDWLEGQFDYMHRQLEREREERGLSEHEYEERLRRIRWKKARKRRRRRLIRLMGFNVWMNITLLRWYKQGRDAGEKSPLAPYAFPMLTGVDAVIYQEQLEEGLNCVLREAGVQKRASLPRYNATPDKKPYEEYYAYPTRRLGEYLLGDLMDRFGYEFEGRTGDNPALWLAREPSRERV